MEEERKKLSTSVLEEITTQDKFAKLVGTELVELQPGFARATLSITEQLVNFHNMAHGAAIFALADLICEAAGNSLGEPAVAIQTNIHFLAPGKCGDILSATGKLNNRIESFGVIEFEVRNQEGLLLSKGQQTVFFKKEKRI